MVSFEDIDLATRITKTDLSLLHGATYFITVKATNLAGLSSNITSLGLMIDTTSPLADNDDIKDGSSDKDVDYFSLMWDYRHIGKRLKIPKAASCKASIA